MNQPRGGDPQDFLPTQELGPASARPGQGGGLPDRASRTAGLSRSPAEPAAATGGSEVGHAGRSDGRDGQAGRSPPGRHGPGGAWGVVPPGQAAPPGSGGAPGSRWSRCWPAAARSRSPRSRAARPRRPPGPTGQAAVLNTMLSSALVARVGGRPPTASRPGPRPRAAHPCLSRRGQAQGGRAPHRGQGRAAALPPAAADPARSAGFTASSRSRPRTGRAPSPTSAA